MLKICNKTKYTKNFLNSVSQTILTNGKTALNLR